MNTYVPSCLDLVTTTRKKMSCHALSFDKKSEQTFLKQVGHSQGRS